MNTTAAVLSIAASFRLLHTVQQRREKLSACQPRMDHMVAHVVDLAPGAQAALAEFELGAAGRQRVETTCMLQHQSVKPIPNSFMLLLLVVHFMPRAQA